MCKRLTHKGLHLCILIGFYIFFILILRMFALNSGFMCCCTVAENLNIVQLLPLELTHFWI